MPHPEVAAQGFAVKPTFETDDMLLLDIGIIKRIDAGIEPHDRSAFVTSIAGRIDRLANNGEGELVAKTLQYIRAQQADMPKPIFTERHKVWQLAAVSDGVNAGRKTGIKHIAKAAGVEIVANHDADRIPMASGKPRVSAIVQTRE